jgi:SAM-dependent methyltransferase
MGIATCSPFDTEREKYARVWADVAEYRTVSPGEQLVGPFLAMTGVKPGQSIVDVGCGTGRAAMKLRALQMDVTLVDATKFALDEEVEKYIEECKEERFIETCLWQHWTERFEPRDFAFCCDVLEHIPKEFTMLVVERCLQATQTAFFSIAFDADSFGATIGEPLHLTMESFEWWRDHLGELGHLYEARDLQARGLFLLGR